MDQHPEGPSSSGNVTQANTSTGLSPNVAGALSYLFGAITGIIFLVIEKKSSFVRFHAAQSIGIFVFFIVASIVLTVVSMILGSIPGIGWLFGILFFLISMALSLGGLVLWLFLMFQAFQGKEWEFPWVGPKVREMFGTNGDI